MPITGYYIISLAGYTTFQKFVIVGIFFHELYLFGYFSRDSKRGEIQNNPVYLLLFEMKFFLKFVSYFLFNFQ